MRRFVLAAGLLTTAACVNPYRVNFNTTLDRVPKWMGERLAPSSGAPRLLKSNDIRSDGRALFEQGYVMIGYAKFDGPAINPDLALEQGRKAGADVVLLQETFTRSMTENVAVTQWSPDQTTETTETAQSTGRGGKPHTVTRTVETRVSQDPQTVYVPTTVDYFEHSATFWRRVDKPLFGALVQDIADDVKMRLQTNHGLEIQAIITDSPAFEADLLKGDVILKLDGDPVPSAQKFYADLISHAGKTIHLSVLRGSTPLEKPVKLNP
ncbi:MAG: PDZ domain-containing protein [Elusimicrobia bacterium]|nr:PDZ domain-containing protein [Elusimicrobiota bacterium]